MKIKRIPLPPSGSGRRIGRPRRPLSSATARAIRSRLLGWYDAHRRDLPWRRKKTPYRVWLAEVMLQQTQVETVIPYYERFLRRFPSVRTLARAKVDAVYRAWAGLGYYSRARNLHAAAREITERYGGRIPRKEADLLSLPGVGPYTAGAVRSIAFGEAAPIVDGNAARVLARLFGVRKGPAAAATNRELWSIARSLVPEDRPGEFNQALMELGSLVCLPKSPRCHECPARPLCIARRENLVSRIPVPRRATAKPARAAWAVVRRGDRILLALRPPGGLLGGLWALPGVELRKRDRAEPALRRFLRNELGLSAEVEPPLAEIRHLFSHRDLRLTLHPCSLRRDGSLGRARNGPYMQLRWVSPARPAVIARSALLKKALEAVRSHPRDCKGARPRVSSALSGPVRGSALGRAKASIDGTVRPPKTTRF